MKPKTLPKTWIIFFVLIVILVVGASIEAGNSPKNTAKASMTKAVAVVASPQNEDFKIAGSGNVLELTDQVRGAKSVTVRSVAFSSPGFVAIYADDHGMPGPLIGFSSLVNGSKEGLVISTSQALEPGKIYYAMMFKDDGDEKFDAKKDVQMSDEHSTVILVNFVADL